MTADDDDLDDASLKSMRAVWLSMRDEEPPAAGMSALLAAAAEKADQLRDETQPWWQRALAFLRRPPALAFATVMILIGGAVLVTRTSSDKKTEAEVAAPTPAVEESRQFGGAGSGAIAAPNAPAADPADEAEKRSETPPPPPPPPPVVEKPPVRPKNGKVKAKEDPRPEPNRYDRFDDEPKTNAESGADRSDLDGTKLETPARIRDDKGGAKQVTETLDVTGTSPAPKAPESSAGEREQQAPTIEQLAKQAEAAATRGDCAAVKALVARIKQLNEGFYKTRLGKSAAVTKCL